MTSKLNIHKYLTPDIAAHCKKIKHVFSPLEMAVIVAFSKKTVKEKLAAWQAIIDECPDMPIRPNDARNSAWWQGLKKDHPDIDSEPNPLQPCATFRAKDSLHEYLKRHIAWHERQIEDFCGGGEGIVFRPFPCVAGATEYWYGREEIGSYPTLQKALDAVGRYAAENGFGIDKTKIVRQRIDEDDRGNDSALFTPEGELLDTLRCHEEGDLEDIFIHVPVPFQKGDIVTDSDGEPMVLVALPQWDSDYEEYTSGRFGDGTDMCGLAFAAESFFDDSSEHEHPETLELRYYTKELQGRERFLKAFSEFVKDQGEGRASLAVHLIGAFRKFQAETEAERLANIWDKWFTQTDDLEKPPTNVLEAMYRSCRAKPSEKDEVQKTTNT